jgi:hypothetical protein
MGNKIMLYEDMKHVAYWLSQTKNPTMALKEKSSMHGARTVIQRARLTCFDETTDSVESQESLTQLTP